MSYILLTLLLLMFSYLADKHRVILKNDIDYIHKNDIDDIDYIHASYIDVRISIHLSVHLLIYPFVVSLGLQTT